MALQKKLLHYIQHMWIYMVVMVMFAVIAGGLMVAQAYGLAHIIASVFLAHQTFGDALLPLIVLLLVIAGRAVLVGISEWIAQYAASRVKGQLRQQLFAHLLQLGPQYAKGERSGELVNTLVDGVEALDAYFQQFLPQICTVIAIPALVIVIVFLIDPLSGIILLLTLPILPFFMILIGKRANAMTQRRWHVLGQMSAHFLDVLQGLPTLKLFGRSQVQRETVRTVSERFGAVTLSVLSVAFLSSFVMEMGATISTALVAVEVGLRLLYGTMSFERAFFVLLLAPEYYLPLRALGPQFHAAMSSMAAGERIFALLETPISIRACEAAVPHVVPRVLAFKEVGFSYSSDSEKEGEGGRAALAQVSFEVRAGRKVALIGASGAGKSTLAHLLLRFIEPQQGEIRVYGEDGEVCALQDIPVQEWRGQIAWQPQRPTLFHGSVAENIRMGRPGASMQEVKHAAQQAHLHEVIEALPQGYETLIGERGARLSGGEVQRLSLARALIKDAPILLLDEATSTLDSESESYVLQTLDEVARTRIVLMIAHRLHTITSADQIIMLDAGRVVECGTHEELVRRSWRYQEMLRAYAGEGVAV